MTPSDDQQGALVRGVRTLTGVVERTGSCTTLAVGTQRWALVGMIADSLSPGETVRVTGQITQDSTACSTLNPTSTLQVTRADPA